MLAGNSLTVSPSERYATHARTRSRPSGRRAVFAAAAFAEVLGDRALEFRREGSRADAGRERLRDPEDVREELWPHARADRGGSRHAVARRAERVDAMVDAEVRALRALEQDALPAPQRRVEPCRRIDDERREALPVGGMLGEDRLRVEPLVAAVRLDEPLLDRHDRPEF